MFVITGQLLVIHAGEAAEDVGIQSLYIALFSCRAFFRRSIGFGKEFTKCARGTNFCVVDEVNRTNCKKCRFEKCLQVNLNIRLTLIIF